SIPVATPMPKSAKPPRAAPCSPSASRTRTATGSSLRKRKPERSAACAASSRTRRGGCWGGRTHYPVVERADEVPVDVLDFVDNPYRTEIPPLLRREVGAHFRLAANTSEPLDQVQVVALHQPEGQVDQLRVAGQQCLMVGVVHELEDRLLRA